MIRLGLDGRELQEGVHTGIGRYVLQILTAALEAGMECVVYQDRPSPLPPSVQDAHRCLIPSRWSIGWDQIALPCQIRKDRLSVFLSPYYKAPIFSPCPVVLTIHDLFFIGYPGRSRPLYDLLLTGVSKVYAARAQAIITDSEYSKRSIVTRLGISSEKVHAIPLAVPGGFGLQGFRENMNESLSVAQPYILYVGNFKPHKNLIRLVDAYSQLPSTLRKGVRLVLAGYEDLHRSVLEAYVEKIGLEKQVVFLGAIADQDLSALYTGAQLLVLPSLVEGFGLTALEAMACGCPVAASDRSSIPEVVGDAACLFDPEDIQSMSRALYRLLTENELREHCRRLGLARVAEFTPEKTTRRILNLITEMCTDSRPKMRERPISEGSDSVKQSAKGDLVSR